MSFGPLKKKSRPLNYSLIARLCFLEVCITVVEHSFHSLQKKNFHLNKQDEIVNHRLLVFSHIMEPANSSPVAGFGAGFTPRVQQGGKTAEALKPDKDLLCSLYLRVTLSPS